MAIKCAPSICASTSLSELECKGAPSGDDDVVTRALPPAGVISDAFLSKYFSCSATHTAERAMFDTAVRIVTSPSSFVAHGFAPRTRSKQGRREIKKIKKIEFVHMEQSRDSHFIPSYRLPATERNF